MLPLPVGYVSVRNRAAVRPVRRKAQRCVPLARGGRGAGGRVTFLLFTERGEPKYRFPAFSEIITLISDSVRRELHLSTRALPLTT